MRFYCWQNFSSVIRGFGVWVVARLLASGYLESTDATPRSPYQSPTWCPASDSSTLPFFFFLSHTDLARFALIRAKTGWFERIPSETGTDTVETATKTCHYGRFWPKRPPKQAEMGSGYHSSASCGLVRGKKIKKREGRKRWEDTKKKGWKKNKGI